MYQKTTPSADTYGFTTSNVNVTIFFKELDTILCAEGKCNKVNFSSGVLGVNYTTSASSFYRQFQSGTAVYYWSYLFEFNYSNYRFRFNETFTQDIFSQITGIYAKGGLTPAGLNQLIYVKADNYQNNVILTEYNNEKYIIAAGLTTGESFYSDTALRHYIICDYPNPNSPVVGIMPVSSTGSIMLDIDSACSAAGSTTPSVNETQQTIVGILADECGQFTKTENETTLNISAETNATYKIVERYKNGTVNQIITTTNFSYSYNKSAIKQVSVFCYLNKYDFKSKKMVQTKALVYSFSSGFGGLSIFSEVYLPYIFLIGVLPFLFLLGRNMPVMLIGVNLFLILFNAMGILYVPLVFMATIILLSIIALVLSKGGKL